MSVRPKDACSYADHSNDLSGLSRGTKGIVGTILRQVRNDGLGALRRGEQGCIDGDVVIGIFVNIVELRQCLAEGSVGASQLTLDQGFRRAENANKE